MDFHERRLEGQRMRKEALESTVILQLMQPQSGQRLGDFASSYLILHKKSCPFDIDLHQPTIRVTHFYITLLPGLRQFRYFHVRLLSYLLRQTTIQFLILLRLTSDSHPTYAIVREFTFSCCPIYVIS